MIPMRTKVRLFPWLLAGLSAYWIATSWLPAPAAPKTDRDTRGFSALARQLDIPPGYLRLYRAAPAKVCPGLSWYTLAAIGRVESGHGQNMGPSSAGALGPMQFMPGTWAAYGRGGDINDPADAIPAAARYLCAHNAIWDERGALFAYNHAWSYVDLVQDVARRYAAGRPAR
jgi:soluble lytic murein transglycosylase-like protein